MAGFAGAAMVLSHGTTLGWPQSQKIVAPTAVSGRPCCLPHCLQANQIMRGSEGVRSETVSKKPVPLIVAKKTPAGERFCAQAEASGDASCRLFGEGEPAA
jgi:hypothetical protein